ncbi:hypothetical protein CW751_00500 [Brumimicrobium salinarum]|uniref:Uncharacterized protein n=1 Tax=Brumimicrobium salinarum TaxID=2058658 RepID=A0A2I0R5I6_9FLAO|nr:hypothetical protein [Brumimicrobium salinarum]PKR81852.1 hypothetical protein CW751_00500 [Brumimicrobium salinarum]
MKKSIVLSTVLVSSLFFTSCKKCAECHYDSPNGEVEIGEYCGDELEEIEQSGTIVNGTQFEVHCHDH